MVYFGLKVATKENQMAKAMESETGSGGVDWGIWVILAKNHYLLYCNLRGNKI